MARALINHSRPDDPRDGVFISCVSDEFEKTGAAFSGLRGQLRQYLARTRLNVRVQEDFPQTAVDTIEKLDREIRRCAVVVHLVGEKPGAIAHPAAVASYLNGEPTFLANWPDLWAALGDCSGISYTQWEALIALHHGIPLLVYGTDKSATQQPHLDRLKLGRRYATPIKTDADLLGQLIGDIHDILPTVPKFTRQLAPSKLSRHAAKQFFGREDELALLDRAWADPGTHVLSLVAWGGVGKTSLVTHWVATRMAANGWPGVERYYDWSFYSQGTGDSRQTSSDLFISDALKFFGDPDPVLGSPWERGQRLAGLVRQHRTLLVLDGVEPLQYPPTDKSGQAGRLKDQALDALLQSLVQENTGLCVVTTREHLANIDSYPTQQEHKLDKLLLDAATGLIRHLQLVGSDDEIAAMWEELDGHALSMLQLGRLLARGYGRDLRKWREMGFTKADRLKQGRSTMKVMRKYEAWLAGGEKEQQLELAVLRLMGLFEKPMSPGCFAALREPPVIAGLTEQFAGAEDFELEAAVTTLIENELLSHAGGDDYSGPLLSVPLDAHPLIREYFAEQLQTDHPAAFKEAHSQLFDYLCKTTPHRPDGLEGLAPLYEAVTHGCLAGRHAEACDAVYNDRILRGTSPGGFYSSKRLGAIGADLAAVAAFFDTPWSLLSTNLQVADQAWLLNQAAQRLRSLGRLTESLQPTRAGLEMRLQQKNWKAAGRAARNLSGLKVSLGQLADAVSDARKSITYADLSGDAFLQMVCNTGAADALHQSGKRVEAGTLFVDAERMQKERQPEYELLYSVQGFNYCDWLFAPADRVAWQVLIQAGSTARKNPQELAICVDVEHHATRTLGWARQHLGLLDNALDHLTLARVGLARAILANPLPQPTLTLPHVADAVNGIRAAGQVHLLPNGLLTAALYHFVRGEHDLARQHLAEAQQIAERGPMPLFLADVHLHRARMFRDRTELAKAAKLIRDLGYGRRDDELADAVEAAKNW
ncbi:MAG TPA: hypothetical protein VD866_29435 [Urbifossiella sp.]|nr:hypothetical protein [Urbifossiella sp.]